MSRNVERQWFETINMASKILMDNRYQNNHQLNVKVANIITSLAPKLCQNNSLNTYSNSKIKTLSSYRSENWRREVTFPMSQSRARLEDTDCFTLKSMFLNWLWM